MQRREEVPVNAVPVNAQLLRDMMDCVDVSSFSLERKESWLKLRSLVSNDDGAQNDLKRGTSLENILHGINAPSNSQLSDLPRKFNAKDSAHKLKRLLSSGSFSLMEKKASVSALLGLLDSQNGGISQSDANELLRGLGEECTEEELKRLGSSNMFRSFLLQNENGYNEPMNRKKSFDIIQGILNACSNQAIQKPMTSQDSFRFQTLANCLESIEGDVAKFAEEANEDYENEYVVSVDNLDNLLDDKIPSAPTSSKTRNIPIHHGVHSGASSTLNGPNRILNPAFAPPPSNSHVQFNNSFRNNNTSNQPMLGHSNLNGLRNLSNLSSIRDNAPMHQHSMNMMPSPYSTQSNMMHHPIPSSINHGANSNNMYNSNDMYHQQFSHQQMLHSTPSPYPVLMHTNGNPSSSYNYNTSNMNSGAYSNTNSDQLHSLNSHMSMRNNLYPNSNLSDYNTLHHLNHGNMNVNSHIQTNSAINTNSGYSMANSHHQLHPSGNTGNVGGGQYGMPVQSHANTPAEAKFCSTAGCNNIARTKGMCKVHGGGRRCKVDGCMKSAQTGHLCIAHGGGKPCRMEGCPKTAQSRGLCKQHGGGVRCKFEGCTKSCQSGGFCRGHGGGKRCEYTNCKKWAQRNGYCAKHAQELANMAAVK